MNTNYSVAFCLLSGKRRDSFCWVLKRLFAIVKNYNIKHLYVVLSNFNKVFKNALLEICNCNL